METETEYTILNQKADKIKGIMAEAISNTNQFCKQRILTRGGRVGSGMGTLLEALWGFNVNQMLLKDEAVDYEIAWFPDNEYNDFACVRKDTEWDRTTHRGEFFRIEIKSMNSQAAESKAHFDVIEQNLGKFDMLIVLIWNWQTDNDIHFFPMISDFFIGNAQEIARLRDRLHIARGGSFVDKSSCPDGCHPGVCSHHGEPLNASGNRERLSGPGSTKPPSSSHGANFGGLVRMLKTRAKESTVIFRDIRKSSDIAHEYISFIHRNFPNEEFNQFNAKEWIEIAKNCDYKTKDRYDAHEYIRENVSEYQTILRDF